MSDKIIDFPTENSVIHIRTRTGAYIMLSAVIYGFLTAAVLFSHVGTQNHTDQAETALDEQMKRMEERITLRIEHEAGEMNRQYLASQRENDGNFQMAWAHMVKLSSVMERAGVETPPMPEKPEE